MYILPSIPLRNSGRMLQGWSNRYRNVKSSILRVTMNSTILRAVSVEVRQYIRLTSSSAIVLRSILHDNTTSLGVRLFFTHCQQCPLKVPYLLEKLMANTVKVSKGPHYPMEAKKKVAFRPLFRCSTSRFTFIGYMQ